MTNQVLNAGGLIIQRLQAQVPAFTTVSALSALVGTQNLAGLLPAAFVSPDAPEYGEITQSARQVKETQYWWVTIVVQNVNDPRATDTADERAQPLVAGSIEALQGWAPAAGLQPLALVQRDAPDYYIDAAEYRLMFQTGTILKGATA